MSRTILRPNGESWTFDAVLSESYSPTIATTDHPVEDGATVSDHAQVQPLVFGAQVVVSETPMVEEGSTETTGIERVQEARRFLEGCQGELLAVTTTKFGDIDDVLLTRWAHSVTARGEAVFDLGFKRIEFAETGSVLIPPDVTSRAGAPDEQALGIQVARARAQVASAQARAAQDQESASTLYWLTH